MRQWRLHKMNKIALIFIAIAVLVIAAGGIYFFSRESEDDLRKNIENEYYENQSIECPSNYKHEGFNSNLDCEGAIRCISVEMSKLIRKEDLKTMSDKMKWSDNDEHTIVTYSNEELGITNKELDSIMKSCARQYGYKGT